MEEYAQRMGGKFIPNPRSHLPGAGNKMQATHPLGGAPMGTRGNRRRQFGVFNLDEKPWRLSD